MGARCGVLGDVDRKALCQVLSGSRAAEKASEALGEEQAVCTVDDLSAKISEQDAKAVETKPEDEVDAKAEAATREAESATTSASSASSTQPKEVPSIEDASAADAAAEGEPVPVLSFPVAVSGQEEPSVASNAEPAPAVSQPKDQEYSSAAATAEPDPAGNQPKEPAELADGSKDPAKTEGGVKKKKRQPGKKPSPKAKAAAERGVSDAADKAAGEKAGEKADKAKAPTQAAQMDTQAVPLAPVKEEENLTWDLHVTIVEAKRLPRADLGGKSDPYCICEIVGKPESRYETPVKSKDLDPHWNCETMMKGFDFGEGDVLMFQVKDQDWASTDDLLGEAKLTYKDIYPIGFEGVIKLAMAAGFKDSCPTIRVKVRLQRPATVKAAASQGDAATTGAHDAAKQHPKLEEVFKAASGGDLKQVKRCLQDGISLTAENADGCSLLHVASQSGQEDVVAFLLKQDKQALLELRTPSHKETALHLAAKGGFKGLAEKLVLAGAEVCVKNSAGKLPADLAKGSLATWLKHDHPEVTIPPWNK